MKRKLKVNDFFCGCGGMGIAFKNAGYEIAGAWDFDKYAVESYRANVGDHVQKADIKELHQADIPQADVWAFGFPCQDLSVAGKQRGMILKCEDCGEEIEINPEEYTGNTICPKCSSNNFKAASRSGSTIYNLVAAVLNNNMGNVKVSAEEVESYDIEECTAILNAYMEFVDELKANPN